MASRAKSVMPVNFKAYDLPPVSGGPKAHAEQQKLCKSL